MQQRTSTTLTGYKWFYNSKFKKNPVNGGKKRVVNKSLRWKNINAYQILNHCQLRCQGWWLVSHPSPALLGPNRVRTSRLRSFMITYFSFQPTYPGSMWLALCLGCLGWERHSRDEKWVKPDNTMPGFPPHGDCCCSCRPTDAMNCTGIRRQ